MLEPPTLAEVEAARRRISGAVRRTPLVELESEDGSGSVHLKLENLQPIGSFKLRGASNAMAMIPHEQLARGVWTASAGNMAQGVAWQARAHGIPCTVVAPDHAPEAKLGEIRRLGAKVVLVPFVEWWRVMTERTFPGIEGWFIHPVSDPAVIAGNGTIGLEILEDLPGVDTVLVPYGGGGLSCGIAAAIHALKPDVRVLACEVETAAPLAAALAAGAPRTIEYTPSFVDGIGGRGVLEEMWPLARRLLAGSIVVSLEQIAQAIRLLASRARIVAEGAGAAPVAAARTGRAGGRTVACVVSGGNIDAAKLGTLLAGGMP